MFSQHNEGPSADTTNLPLFAPPVFRYIPGEMYRGIVLRKGKTPSMSKSWVPDERSKYNEGHNDHVVGQWWPLRICVLRDRAHGEIVAGICGNEEMGAVSICFGDNGYNNKDEGNVCYPFS